MLRKRRAAVAFFLACVCVVSMGCRDPLDTKLEPAPEYGPQEVVRIQLEALRNNDDQDRGIALAFRFASPANRRITGPLPRFARMIKEEPYDLMLHYEEARFGPLEEESNSARMRVMLIDEGAVRQYVFQLSRRPFAPCEGCWMTDSVLVDESSTRKISL